MTAGHPDSSWCRAAASGGHRSAPEGDMMRRLATVLTSVSVLAGLVVAVAPAASSATVSTQRSARATVRVVVRPVDARGRAVSGFVVRTERTGSVLCGGAPSLAAVNPNIAQCSPSFEFPAACWKAARRHRVLCFDDARNTWVRSIRLQGRFAPTRPPLRRPIPLNMRLRSGTYCGIRIGGAGARLKGHPRWGVTYYCTRGMAVWARLNGRRGGINRARRAWTVHVAPSSGRNPHLRVRRVARAGFVGTAAFRQQP